MLEDLIYAMTRAFLVMLVFTAASLGLYAVAAFSPAVAILLSIFAFLTFVIFITNH